MDEKKTRTIVIVTPTFLSFFILTSWIFGICLGIESLDAFFRETPRWGSFAVILFAVFVFAKMYHWPVSVGWKLLTAVVHIIFALAALFWIWLCWFADFSNPTWLPA
ncbi:MAG: hypothetical protein ACYS8Z_02440 [Planctomycetota bacterium]|jgi:hypothetical protein